MTYYNISYIINYMTAYNLSHREFYISDRIDSNKIFFSNWNETTN